jgi:hypothetical protein
MNEQDMMDAEEREERIRDAAEELLAALKLARREIHNPGAGRFDGLDVLAEIDAAIGKAEGRI